MTSHGRAQCINLAEDLVEHINIAKGQHVKIIPAGKNRFIVETG